MINHFEGEILGCQVSGRGQDVAEIMRRLGVPGADEMMMRGIRADSWNRLIGFKELTICDFGKKVSL